MTPSNTTIFPAARNCWIELSTAALKNNLASFKQLLKKEQLLLCVVKANAYGHGILPVAQTALINGADWLGVFNVEEGVALRSAGINAPILVLGPSFGEQYIVAKDHHLRVTIASVEGLEEYISILENAKALVHLKLETGTNRQGIQYAELKKVSKMIHEHHIPIEGAYTHYADIEDTTDHTFATSQRTQFENSVKKLGGLGIKIKIPHTACTAATILFPNTYFQMVRMGIGTYGLWPSKETNVSAQNLGREKLQLTPVMTWKTKIAQIKTVSTGEYVGYGRTFRATRNTKVAILPVGYADGYSRKLSNTANTLVNGVRARVIGRVCMNLTMIDITDVPDVTVGNHVVLLGKDGDEEITAEQLATCADTINYEIVTRIAPTAPRHLVE